MIKATLRPRLSIKPGWVNVSRPRLRLINEPLSRHISATRMKAMQNALDRKPPDQLFPIPAAETLRPDRRSHDLLVAVAELGALEQRIGYRFNDKLLGISAFKISSEKYPVKSQSIIVPLDDSRRLALLGDRVLDLALCQAWYESGRSRCMYSYLNFTFKVSLCLSPSQGTTARWNQGKYHDGPSLWKA